MVQLSVLILKYILGGGQICKNPMNRMCGNVKLQCNTCVYQEEVTRHENIIVGWFQWQSCWWSWIAVAEVGSGGGLGNQGCVFWFVCFLEGVRRKRKLV